MTWLADVLPSGSFEPMLLLTVTLALSLLGFIRTVFFVSLAYAFSIAAQAVLAAVLFRADIDFATTLQCALLLAYGARLGWYVVERERHPSFKPALEDMNQRSANVSPARKLVIWPVVTLLYVVMFSPAFFNLTALRRGETDLVSIPIGVAIMALGLTLEAAADVQKSRYKKLFPNHYSDWRLYRWMRCPNYFGECVFWLGQWIAGISAYHSAFEWIFSLAGLICIQLVMVGSTRRLESKQQERYGSDSDFQQYVASVPVLIPFVPIYTFKNARIYLG